MDVRIGAARGGVKRRAAKPPQLNANVMGVEFTDNTA
jgi:hypothetical protein